jgi:hypothetical protein
LSALVEQRDMALHDRRRDGPGHQPERLDKWQHPLGLRGDAQATLHHAQRRRDERHLMRRPQHQCLRMPQQVGLQTCSEVAREADEGFAQHLSPAHATAGGERMNTRADEADAVAKQTLLHQLGRRRALRDDAKVRLATGHARKRLLIERVEQVDGNRRVLAAVLHHELRQGGGGIQRRAGNAHRAALFLRKVLRAFKGTRQVLHELSGQRVELIAGQGQRSGARSAVKQAHFHAAFQLLDEQAERRRRQVQATRGGRKAARLGHGNEGPDLP